MSTSILLILWSYKLDMYLRKLIVHMCLDVEHFLKTRLMYDISINEAEDGYNILGSI